MTEINRYQGTFDYYKALVDSLKDYALFTTDKAGIINAWSTGAEKVLLYKPEEIIGKSINLLYTAEDQIALAPATELGTALREGKATDERFHVKKGNLKFWGSGLVFPLFDKKDHHIGFSKIMRNISDDEQAQVNLREEKAIADTIVSTYNECIIILNTNLEVINATTSFINFFSLNKTNILGKQFFQIIDGGLNVAQLRSSLDSTIKNHRFHSSFEVEFVHPQNGTRTLLVKPRRIYQPPNLLFSLQFEDLTEGRAMMEEKDIFITVASHEIRTPISIIKAYGQILTRELNEASPVVKSAVKKVNEQINHISSLISALLDTTKITTGKLVLDPEVFNLCTLVNEITEGFRMTQSSHQIIILNEQDAMVYADKVRTGSVITNLLSNAVKYSPNGKQVIINMETSDNIIKVSIQDFGIGIPEKEQVSLFHRFGRTASVKKSKFPGTGLGLHLSSEIIRLQGGEIGYNTEEGKGSTFNFILPLY